MGYDSDLQALYPTKPMAMQLCVLRLDKSFSVARCHDICCGSYTDMKGMVLKAGDVSDVFSLLHSFINTNSSLGLVH